MYPSDPTPAPPSTPRPFNHSHALELAELYSEAADLRRDRARARWSAIVGFACMLAVLAVQNSRVTALEAELAASEARLAAVRPISTPPGMVPCMGWAGPWSPGVGCYSWSYNSFLYVDAVNDRVGLAPSMPLDIIAP